MGGGRVSIRSGALHGDDVDADSAELRPQPLQTQRAVGLPVEERYSRKVDLSVPEPADDGLQPLRKAAWNPRRDGGEVFQSTTTQALTSPAVRPQNIVQSQERSGGAPRIVCSRLRVESTPITEALNETSNPDGRVTLDVGDPKLAFQDLYKAKGPDGDGVERRCAGKPNALVQTVAKCEMHCPLQPVVCVDSGSRASAVWTRRRPSHDSDVDRSSAAG